MPDTNGSSSKPSTSGRTTKRKRATASARFAKPSVRTKAAKAPVPEIDIPLIEGTDIPDYYALLTVRRDASSEDIRTSFRYLAKKYHPDRNQDRAKWAEQKIRLIIQAYDTLMDRDSRVAYDRKLRQELDPDEDNYRNSLKSQKNDPAAMSKLVLENLLSEHGEEAIEVYEEATKNIEDFDLSRHLEQRDYLDGLFLLGEEYERAGNWMRALEFYHKVYDLESDSPSRFFLDTLKERIRDIYCKKLARRSNPSEAVDVYERVLNLGVPKKTEAYIHKKIAESFFRGGQNKRAKMHLERAFELEPKLKGAQKICEKLNIERKSSSKTSKRTSTKKSTRTSAKKSTRTSAKKSTRKSSRTSAKQ